MAATTPEMPELVEFGVCTACGQSIGWVTVRPGKTRRPVDPQPRALAEYALLRDGRVAVNLRNPTVDPAFESYGGPRFWDHAKTCPVPSMSTARAAGSLFLDYVEDVHRHSGRPSRPHHDLVVESQRAQIRRRYG